MNIDLRRIALIVIIIGSFGASKGLAQVPIDRPEYCPTYEFIWHNWNRIMSSEPFDYEARTFHLVRGFGPITCDHGLRPAIKTVHPDVSPKYFQDLTNFCEFRVMCGKHFTNHFVRIGEVKRQED